MRSLVLVLFVSICPACTPRGTADAPSERRAASVASAASEPSNAALTSAEPSEAAARPSGSESSMLSTTTEGCAPSGGVDGEQCLGLPLADEPAAAVVPVPAARRNVLGTALETCSTDPMTGWFRDGACRTGERDRGVHVVCAEVTAQFLTYTKGRGNDLSTPKPRYGFKGLVPGDRWCLCASRWYEAQRAGHAPKVVLEASHEKALTIVPKDVLAAHRTP